MSPCHTATSSPELAFTTRVAKYSTGRLAASASAAATSGSCDNRCNVTNVGGASSMSPASRRRSASAGGTQTYSWISAPSMVTAPDGAGARKNQVAKRFGATGGGVQCANATSAAGSTT